MEVALFTIIGIGAIVLIWILLFDIPYRDLCHECYREGRKTKIWLFQFPGHRTWYRPEHVIELKNWAGSKYDDLKAVSKEDGREIPEATAGLALMVAGIAGDGTYNIEQGADEHYILRRQASQGKYFDVRAVHQIESCPFGHRNY